MLTWTAYVKIVVALLVVINPLGNSLVFLSLTEGQSRRERARTARVAAGTVAGILGGAAVCGEWMLRLFGIRIATFQVGGGILVLLIAVAMLHARLSPSNHTPEEAVEAQEKNDIAVVPLAIPLLAGPGAISTMIIYAHQGSVWLHAALLCLIAVGVAAAVGLVLSFSWTIQPALGKTGVNILIRLMGLILAAIGVEFMAAGLLDLFPGLN